MPRRFDPNVSLRVIGIALTSRARQLQDPSAYGYALAVRILLPLFVTGFVFVLWYIRANAEP
jgi:hypothetical protein